ncbi:4-hydroxybenzoyl-CoA thioesterase [Labrys sp. KNU-23]|uniref:thioesterase family protein n=1 Tax=Labrys sp. KNU-23 TaxID=2789216 RepID=UPI0011EDDB05|nr:thioesterase family protein [Labrys sp. KNU-23]QEN89332.1 4-hydroxybenzoyl-CoA thioesterase [Labrys sp. KNU-23]
MSRVTTPNEGKPFAGWDWARPIPAPLALHRTPVVEAWTDYNDHMTESAFLLVFGDSSDAFFRLIGVDEAYRAAGSSIYTMETRIRNLREAHIGDPLALTLQLIDHDAKRLHIFHAMTNEASGEVLATAEQILVHVDMQAGRSSPFPPEIAERIEAIAKAHAGLPVAATVGVPLGIRRR